MTMKKANAPSSKSTKNNYLVDGRANLFELGKVLDVSFPDSDAFDSLGGFIISNYGRMPKVGSKIQFDDCSFLIKAADEKRIVQVHVFQSRKRPKLQSSHDAILEERAAA
jgi:CBS domain containing-hemolysin-like protein